LTYYSSTVENFSITYIPRPPEISQWRQPAQRYCIHITKNVQPSIHCRHLYSGPTQKRSILYVCRHYVRYFTYCWGCKNKL